MSDIIDTVSSSRPSAGPDISETVSSSGSSKGERSIVCGVAGTRRLLCREFVVKLGGAELCGRYGGGGSVMLLLSENGFPNPRVFELIETMSEVSMPVR